MTNDSGPAQVTPPPQTWGSRFNKGVMVVAALAMVAWLIPAADPLLIPFALLFWAYIVALVILLEWAVLRVRKRGVPVIPGLPRRFAGKRALLVALCVYVGVITLAREGAFAPDFVLSLSQYTTSANTQFQTNTNSQTSGAGGVRLAGRPVHCDANCTPQDSPACEALLAAISCDDGASPGESASVYARISLGEAPFCFTPLYKSGDLRFDIDATITASNNASGATANHSLHFNGTTHLEMTGVASCYSFQQVLGGEAGRRFVASLNDFLRNN